MDSRQTRNARIINNLCSEKESRIMEALEEFLIFGNAQILPEFISFIFKDSSEHYRDHAFRILNDIKDTEAIPVLAEALHQYRGKKDYSYLVSSCWQNGMDFSPYIQQFMDIMIKDELNVAIEAFSVIEENFHHLENTEKQDILNTLRENSIIAENDCKKKLILALLSMLEDNNPLN